MRRVVICSGVLGGGTALVFALAAVTASLFPHGTVVPTSQFGRGGVWMDDVRMVPGGPIGVPMAEPFIVLEGDGAEGKP
jgi:hypothetical protein